MKKLCQFRLKTELVGNKFIRENCVRGIVWDNKNNRWQRHTTKLRQALALYFFFNTFLISSVPDRIAAIKLEEKFANMQRGNKVSDDDKRE